MSAPKTMFEKVWAAHEVVPQTAETPAVIFIDLHLTHEVTSPQAFVILRDRGLKVRRPDLTLATMDHATPTRTEQVFGGAPITIEAAAKQIRCLEDNCKEFGVELIGLQDPQRGIVHIIGPDLGATQPGKTIVCGDSHTSTHGAFGALAFGIGTTEVGHVFATQCLLQNKPKTFAVNVHGRLKPGVTAKDLILAIIGKVGVAGGTGHVIEYRGEAIRAMSMEERMTVCNMSIEGGARCGYINPDQTTVDYLKGRPFAPTDAEFEKAATWWLSLASAPDAEFDDRVVFDGSTIEPTVTWGINPAQAIGVGELLPAVASFPKDDQKGVQEAFEYMSLKENTPIKGQKIDVAFIGSCTNGRISDLREAAAIVKGKHVA